VRDRLQAEGILTAAEIGEQQTLLRGLSPKSLPPAWGSHRVTCVS
jgi:hypothetical protein